ncbi:MAG: transporter [Rhodospirillales bacterium]|nr:transporter [Rhodospirillales bacterium]
MSPPVHQFSPREIRIVVFGAVLGMFLASLDATIVATALPQIGRETNALEHVGWIVTAYLITSTAASPIYGRLSDLYGRRTMLQTAILIFVAASILCALANSFVTLALARALQGVGGGGLIAMAHATIADVVAPRDRGRYQGIISGAFAASNVLGPILGGVLTQRAGWPWIFWINLPLGLICVVVARAALKRLHTVRVERRIDWVGAVLLILATTATLLVASLGGRDLAWRSVELASLAGLAVVLWLAFVQRQRVASDPILPPRMFRIAPYRVTIASTALATMSLTGLTVLLPLYLQLSRGLNPEAAGFSLIPATLGSVSGSLLAGWWISRTGRYKFFPMLGFALGALGSALLAWRAPDLTPLSLLPILGALGLGIGFTFPTTMVIVQNAVERRDLGSATASVSFFRSLGGAIGVALLYAVFSVAFGTGAGGESGLVLLDRAAGSAAPLAEATRTAALDGFRAAFACAGAVAVIGFFLALFLEEMPLRRGDAPLPAVE